MGAGMLSVAVKVSHVILSSKSSHRATRFALILSSQLFHRVTWLLLTKLLPHKVGCMLAINLSIRVMMRDTESVSTLIGIKDWRRGNTVCGGVMCDRSEKPDQYPVKSK